MNVNINNLFTYVLNTQQYFQQVLKIYFHAKCRVNPKGLKYKPIELRQGTHPNNASYVLLGKSRELLSKNTLVI